MDRIPNSTKIMAPESPESVSATHKNRLVADIVMNDIVERNCDNMCIEIGCNELYTQFTKINVNGIELFIPLCDEHADKFVENSKTCRREE